MPIGAFNKLDRELVKKYSKLKVDNPDTTKLVDSQKMMEAMNDYAMLQRGMIDMNEKIRAMCSNVAGKSATYMKINFYPPKPRR